MGATSGHLMQRRCIPFASGARLILDRENGVVRVALYRKTKGTDWQAGIDKPLHKRLTEAGFLPESSPLDWKRFAAKHTDWRIAVQKVLWAADLGHLERQTQEYIGAMGWREEPEAK